MKLVKSRLALSIISLLSFPVIAADKGNNLNEFVEVYGRADVSVQSSDEGDGNFTEIKSNASRIRIKPLSKTLRHR